ncbi:MAG: replication protein C [Methanocorpusculum sp.]|nr:replication protein C [Methanocorpusculum sp.]
MLWIEKYRPQSYAEILGQKSPAGRLSSYAEAGNLPHLMIIGRSGVGKSCALDIFSKQFFIEGSAENTTVLPVAVMFSQGHDYLSQNEKFSHLYQKNKSVIANFKHIVKWHASLQPLSAPFRIIIFDGAGDLPKDAQAALRRIMEKYSKTCRFVFVTESLASLIDPIRSRCVPLYFLPIEENTMRNHLKMVLEKENCTDKVSSENLEMIILASAGDLRKAMVWLEIMALHGVTNLADISKTETSVLANECVSLCRNHQMTAAQKIAEDLQVQYGLSASDVLLLIRNEFGDMTPESALIFADYDLKIRTGGNEFIQMNAFIAELCESV